MNAEAAQLQTWISCQINGLKVETERLVFEKKEIRNHSCLMLKPHHICDHISLPKA